MLTDSCLPVLINDSMFVLLFIVVMDSCVDRSFFKPAFDYLNNTDC